jgi:hypothetical protein
MEDFISQHSRQAGSGFGDVERRPHGEICARSTPEDPATSSSVEKRILIGAIAVMDICSANKLFLAHEKTVDTTAHRASVLSISVKRYTPACTFTSSSTCC